MMVLQQACRLSPEPIVRFAALVHDLGKGTTPKTEWPKHINHEERGVPLVEVLCRRYKIPNNFRDLAVLVTRYHLHYHRAAELKPATLFKTLQAVDAMRRPQRYAQFLLACEADSRGRTGYETRHFEQPAIMRAALKAVTEISVQPLLEEGLQGKQLADKLDRLRIKAISNITRSS